MPDTQFAPPNHPARNGRSVALLALALAATSHAWALGPQDPTAAGPDQAGWWGTTHLIDIRQGSSLSKTARDLRDGGYELANGDTVDFRQWYSARWTDVGVTWMTQVTPQWGLIWGFSTGERGAKYTIDPSLKLGFLFQQPTGRNAWLSVRYTTAFGGRLRERSCTADYGAIGGVQAVNCRLAASTLAPADTLHYLVNKPSADLNQLSVSFTWRF
jgi:hypothetical protein